MKLNQLHIILWLSLLSIMLQAQHTIEFPMNYSLKAKKGQKAELEASGKKGFFHRERSPMWDNEQRAVYVFSGNSGLILDNTKLKRPILGSYAIEMLFRYEDGDLLLYRQLLGKQAKIHQGEFIHFVLTRNAVTQKVLVYLNGVKEMEFHDSKNHIELSLNSQLELFHQRGQRSSAGAVAWVKIYDQFMDEDRAKTIFEPLMPDEKGIENLQSGEKLVMKNLYFQQGRPKILPESYTTLDRLLVYLKKHKKINIELHGHTDSLGDASLNQKLSEERAKAVKSYLVDRGVDSYRIIAIGHGGHEPIADNSSENMRALNRRVELLVR